MENKRIKKDFLEVNNSNETGELKYKVELIGNSYLELKAEIVGLSGTPYENGKFILKIDGLENYPFARPKVVFMTKVWHPHISATGAISADYLIDQWSPIMTLTSLCYCIQMFMTTMLIYEVKNTDALKQYQNNQHLFNQTARHWTNVYARGPSINLEFVTKTRRLIDMGISHDQAISVLSTANWDLEQAIHLVIGID